MVKNPPATRGTWARSLGQEQPLEKGKAAHSSILVWRIPMDRGAQWAAVHGGHKELDTAEHSISRPQAAGRGLSCPPHPGLAGGCRAQGCCPQGISICPTGSLGQEDPGSLALKTCAFSYLAKL